MAGINTQIEEFANVQVANVPVGLGAIIFASDMLSAASIELIKKLEDSMNLGAGEMSRTLIDVAGVAGTAWLLSNYGDDVIGQKTANIVSAVVVARGADKIVGDMLTKKNETSKPVTERLAEMVRKIGTTGTVSKAPGIEAETKIAGYEYLPDYNFGYTPPSNNFGYVPNVTNFLPDRIKPKVALEDLMK